MELESQTTAAIPGDQIYAHTAQHTLGMFPAAAPPVAAPVAAAPPVAAPGLVFALACTFVTLCSGITYNWAALQPLLEDPAEGFFAESGNQAFALNTLSTIGIAANALSRFPLGCFLDTYGQRATAVMGGSMFAVGALMIALCDRASLLQVGAGYLLLGLGGPFVQLSTFGFTALFTGRAAAMSTILMCFEVSSGVFAIFGMLHPVFNLRELFLGLACIGILVIISAFRFWPHGPRGNPNAHQAKLCQQVRSQKFLYAAIFLIVQVLRQGFVMATVGQRADANFGDEVGHAMEKWFSVILPLGFAPSAVFTAMGCADMMDANPWATFFGVNILSSIYGLALVVPSIAAHYIALVLFPIVRQLVFTICFTFLTKSFGYGSLGRLSGIASTTAGLLQMLVMESLDLLVEGAASSAKARRFRRIDVVLGVLPLVFLAHPMRQLRKARNAGRTAILQQQQEQQQEEQQ